MSEQSFEEQYKAMIKSQIRFYVVVGSVVAIILVGMMLLWNPLLKPWTQERKGMANLAQAEYENLIRAERASAESEAAVLRAQAIEIIGAVAKEYPEYHSQEFIAGFAAALENGTIDQTFYIPTRNSIPVLPALDDLEAN